MAMSSIKQEKNAFSQYPSRIKKCMLQNELGNFIVMESPLKNYFLKKSNSLNDIVWFNILGNRN